MRPVVLAVHGDGASSGAADRTCSTIRPIAILRKRDPRVPRAEFFSARNLYGNSERYHLGRDLDPVYERGRPCFFQSLCNVSQLNLLVGSRDNSTFQYLASLANKLVSGSVRLSFRPVAHSDQRMAATPNGSR